MPDQANTQSSISAQLVVSTFAGKQETVTVRVLRTSRHFQNYFRLLDESERLAEYLCGKEPFWADSLLPEHVLAIVVRGFDLNIALASQWAAFFKRVGEAAESTPKHSGLTGSLQSRPHPGRN